MVEVVGRVGGQLLHWSALDGIALVLWHLRLNAVRPGADSAVVAGSK